MTEAQERDAKIRAMLANIPCMSRETLESNRQKIQQQQPGRQEERKSQLFVKEQKHEAMLNDLKSSVVERAKRQWEESGGSPIKLGRMDRE